MRTILFDPPTRISISPFVVSGLLKISVPVPLLCTVNASFAALLTAANVTPLPVPVVVTLNPFPAVAALDITWKPILDDVPTSKLPALSTEKSVDVPVWVEEPIANKVVLVAPLSEWIDKLANGDVEPTPIKPADEIVVVPVEPKYVVLNIASADEVAATAVPKLVVKVKGFAPDT